MNTEYERMLAGQYYKPSDPELHDLRQRSRDLQWQFNHEYDSNKRKVIIKEWFGTTGENFYIEPSFSCDYGSNIHVGENFYANFNCIFLDICEIRIGENAMFGPGVQLLTPLHPLDAQERISGLEYGAPITIGDNFWAGGNVTILPGVTLGDNVVVGAGAVVTKSFGNNLVLGGNPARIIKKL
ncbi:sugar O-acetyltransferase [Streptococcus massiliensis]|uniref:Acetyltransferase n=1 Tax=Streptococcus massiliensis TaxID=313439 RepID=A0A380KXS0_9STRE|nr:sugar O-acetyltransferase [Streptococcus massiliensis]SUN75944.1 acetyltransferase [Streptococcus massiliensis]